MCEFDLVCVLFNIFSRDLAGRVVKCNMVRLGIGQNYKCVLNDLNSCEEDNEGG